MKRIIILFVVISSYLVSNITLKEIDMMIDKIKKPRDGILLEALSSTPDPFKQLVSPVSDFNSTNNITLKKDKDFSLNAIMNGKAFIDGKWHIPKDIVSDYEVIFIGKKGVVLARERNIIKLFLKKKKKSIIHIEER
jgi:hypothetical protein